MLSGATAVSTTPAAGGATPAARAADPPVDGLELPPGFQATVFAEGVGPGTRHLVVRDNGDVLVSRQNGRLVGLKDDDGDGVVDRSDERKVPITSGIALHGGYVYFSDNSSVSRIALDTSLVPGGSVETVVTGFPAQGSHATKDLAISPAGELFVNVGAPSNACQEKARTPGSPGQDPCPQLIRQAAVWRFPADRTGQRQEDGVRYVTGTRNIVALDWNDDNGSLYFVMHGRDQLSHLFPERFDDQQSASMPAEEFHRAVAGANYGWPYTFVDPATGRRLVAPEYGGDGTREAVAGKYQKPLHAYPAHWAPNDLVFYDGTAFPERYRGGAFVAWRGSWNRAPLPQDGYRVTFQPMRGGIPSGAPEDFMTGFKGTDTLLRPSDARYRPGGLAIGPDGALYVADGVQGRIWRVTWRG